MIELLYQLEFHMKNIFWNFVLPDKEFHILYTYIYIKLNKIKLFLSVFPSFNQARVCTLTTIKLSIIELNKKYFYCPAKFQYVLNLIYIYIILAELHSFAQMRIKVN